MRCGGTLYWQFNDVYPGPTWSSIDFEGNYKAAHYIVKNSFKDVLVHWDNDSLHLSNLSNDHCKIQINYKSLELTLLI